MIISLGWGTCLRLAKYLRDQPLTLIPLDPVGLDGMTVPYRIKGRVASCTDMTRRPVNFEQSPRLTQSWWPSTDSDAPAGPPSEHGGDEASLAYQEGLTLPRLVIYTVATGGLIDLPSVPSSVRHVAASQLGSKQPAVLVLELGSARFEVQTLLEMLTPLAREIRAGRFGDVVLVVATSQESVARLVGMISETEDLPMYVTLTATQVREAHPAGRLTPTEKASLDVLDLLGGHVTVNRFASETSLELTAAGNRLSNLARRGYVLRLPRSRREGDVFVSLAAYPAQGEPIVSSIDERLLRAYDGQSSGDYVS